MTKRPFWAKCTADGHIWPLAYLPMEMRAAARVMKAARCPMCGSKKIVPAKQDNGVLNEPAGRALLQETSDDHD